MLPRVTSSHRRPGVAGVALAAAVALAAIAGPARADATAEQRAAAQVLFDDARRLMADKRWAEACPKLEESQRIDPGIGTLLNLAECQAQTGKTASAWANFLEASYQAKAAGQAKRETTARTKAAALEPRLSKLTIEAPAGVEVRRDGVAMAPSMLGTPLPVDPGTHVLRATAPGKKPWEKTIVVKDNADRVTVGVPTLDPADRPPHVEATAPPPPLSTAETPSPAPPPVEANVPVADRGAAARRTSGIVLLAVGAGGLVAAGAFTGVAKSKYNASLDMGCSRTPPVTCTTAAAATRNAARAWGNAATGAVVAGGTVAAGGLALLLSALPLGKPAGGVTVTAGVDPRGGAAVGVTGSF
jgi:hypothetical protein